MSNKYLKKNEELELGFLVQDMLKAKKEIENDNSLEKDVVIQKRISLGEKAIEKLVRANTGLVYNQARMFKQKYPSAPDLDDLVQDGMAGLMTAINRYNPERGNKLSTVATYWIFQSITRWTNKTGRLVKLPENRITNFTHISRLRKKYEYDGVPINEIDNIIMEDLSLTKEDFANIINAASAPTSLNKEISSDDSNSKELIDIITEKQSTKSSESFVMKDAIFDILEEQINDLTDMEKDVISSSYLIERNNDSSITPRMVKEKYGLTTSKFKGILNTALNKLKYSLNDLDIVYSDFID